MSGGELLIRNISDTARWAAVYRARETDRPDALFRDPFARGLAGARGEEIAASMPFSDRATWAWVTRTYLFDQYITEQIAQGVEQDSDHTGLAPASPPPQSPNGLRSVRGQPLAGRTRSAVAGKTLSCLRNASRWFSPK